jgi:hypothetical protein
MANVAVPDPTDCRLAPAEAVHAPPTSAVPRPPVTVRAKSSEASTGSPATVTACWVVPVAPSSSVTVSVTV